ncbi:MAG: hypothetical protein ACK5JD_05825 [Mangrovibacterium sp.]
MNRKTLGLLLCLVSASTAAQSPMEKMLKDVAGTQKAQQLKSPNVEFLSGRIFITINEVTYHLPIKKGMRRCEQKKTSISGNFYGRISNGRVKTYTVKPGERSNCEADMHCPVFDGSSKYVLERDLNTMKVTKSKEYPLMVSSQYMEQDFRWLKEKEQYVVTASTSTAGTNTLEGLNIEIKPYKPAQNTQGATLAPLQPPYVLWITGGRDWKLAGEPEAPGKNLRWDDAKEKLLPQQGVLSLGIPYEINSPERPREDGKNRYEQLLLNDVKGFDDFLLNPMREYGISATATRYYNDDYSEKKISITLTMSLGPDIELAPLKPIDDPELAPLEPLGDEIELAPLEPVKD